MRRIRHGNAHTLTYSRRLQKNRLGNPLFATRRSRARPTNWHLIGIIFMVALPLAAMVTSAGYVVWGPWFRIQTPVITGATPDTSEAIHVLLSARLADRRFGLLPENSLFVFNRSEFIKDLGDRFLFDALKVSLHWPNRLTIDVKEKDVMAVFLSGGRFYALDDDGRVIRDLYVKELARLGELPPGYPNAMSKVSGVALVEVPNPAPTNAENGAAPPATSGDATTVAASPYPIVLDGTPADSQKEFRVGDSAMPRAALLVARQAGARWPASVSVPIRWYTIRDAGETLEVMTGEGWRAIFGVSLPFDAQLARLALVLKDKIGSDSSRLDYVDLRYNERIFYKLREPDAAPEPDASSVPSREENPTTTR
ncbi:MAG: hypothetical protein PHT12_01270 [Patescibacteria group bacterium]|nr:hypothetical protein [Patescibacteria group bacterium]